MTVPSEVSSVSYSGNGTTTVFAIPFYFLENSHIKVILRSSTGSETTWVINVNFTLTGAGVQAGGTLTATVAPATGTTLVISRSVPATQETDYPANDPFPSSSHERALDKLTMIVQQNSAGIKGAIRVPDTDPEPARLPTATVRANLLFGFDGSGNPIVVAPVSGSAADLATNLANTADVAKGAGQIGRNDQIVNSITELRALLKTSASKFAFVNGYYVAGDGGGGQYYLDAADTTSADNGGTIIVATDGGRWKLIFTDSVSTGQFGAKGDSVTDDTAAVQAAVTWTVTNAKDLTVNGLCRLTASVNIDRQVDGAAFDSWYHITSENGGGFFVDSAIPMFSSTIAFTTDPVTQLIKFNKVRFVSSSTALAAFVLNGARFLRTMFNECSFSKIKCLNATTYTQSIYFIGCNVRRWTGTFFKSTPQGYDIQVIGGIYEAGTGDCFDISSPIGCKFVTIIEGMSGTALKINGAQGVDISCYFEANGKDIDSRTGGIINRGINVHGSYFAHTPADFSILWGECKGCVSQGNWHTNNMHDLQTNSEVEINDFAQTNLSSTGDVVEHGGYREGNTPALTLRGGGSAAYTTTGLTSKYTLNGNRVDIEFVATLTSTGTNSADVLFIPSTLPFTARTSSMLCGHVWVVSSTVNNGISPLFLSSTTQVTSAINVIPANVATDSWTVRGQISYMIV